MWEWMWIARTHSSLPLYAAVFIVVVIVVSMLICVSTHKFHQFIQQSPHSPRHKNGTAQLYGIEYLQRKHIGNWEICHILAAGLTCGFAIEVKMSSHSMRREQKKYILKSTTLQLTTTTNTRQFSLNYNLWSLSEMDFDDWFFSLLLFSPYMHKHQPMLYSYLAH